MFYKVGRHFDVRRSDSHRQVIGVVDVLRAQTSGHTFADSIGDAAAYYCLCFSLCMGLLGTVTINAQWRILSDLPMWGIRPQALFARITRPAVLATISAKAWAHPGR